MRSSILRCALSLAVCAALAAPAAASSFLVNTSESNSRLYSVDAVTGGSTLIGSTGVAFLSDIAMSPTGDLYGTDGSDLYSIDPSDASSTFVGNIGAIFIVGLDFTDAGVLWGVDEGSNEVWTIDTGTGSGTFEFGTGVVFNGDIAHDSGDIFYASGQFLAERNLFELDAGAESATDQGLIAGGTFTTGLDYDINGTLYAFMSDGDIYEIASPATSGAGTFSAASGLSIAGATEFVPEPGTALLLAAGLVGLAGGRRAQRL